MNIEKFINLDFLANNSFFKIVFPLLVIFLVSISNYLIFMVVPSERQMGAVQRIFYFHVGSAMTAYLMIGILFVSSSFYLVTKKKEWDFLAEASNSIGLVFCTIVLLTGMIWGHSAWNTWWRWEPRLVSFLVLWLVLLSYLLLREFTSKSALTKNFAAVLGIIAAVNVPMVMFSIKLLDQSEQLHPEVVAKQGLVDPSFTYTLLISILSLVLLSVWFLKLKLGATILNDKLTNLQIDIFNR